MGKDINFSAWVTSRGRPVKKCKKKISWSGEIFSVSSRPIVPPAEQGAHSDIYQSDRNHQGVELAGPHVSTPDLYANAHVTLRSFPGLRVVGDVWVQLRCAKTTRSGIPYRDDVRRRHGRNQDRRRRDVKQPSSPSAKKNLDQVD